MEKGYRRFVVCAFDDRKAIGGLFDAVESFDTLAEAIDFMIADIKSCPTRISVREQWSIFDLRDQDTTWSFRGRAVDPNGRYKSIRDMTDEELDALRARYAPASHASDKSTAIPDCLPDPRD